MTITYELHNSLYVNITNKCSNACEFCVRTMKDSVNGRDPLWLDREPTIDEIKEDFKKRDLSKYDAVVFCGYGEPMERYADVIELSKWLKSIHPNVKIRINTNGHANLIAERDITPEFKDIIDCISISLNAATAEKYQKICHSRYGKDSYIALQDFAARAKQFVPEVVFSVVDKTMPSEDIEICRAIAEKCGVSFRVREYIEN